MIININEIDEKINIFYGMVLMHGTDKDKENANIIIDWINFLEKNIGIKRCPICNRKFTAKRKNQIYCSKECNLKNYWSKLTDEERKKKYKQSSKYQKYNENRKEYMKEYWKNHKDKKREYNARYREKKRLEDKE